MCGKNGTSKSSILGIIAQIFSFDKDYVKSGDLVFRQIAGGSFKSRYTEHFRISDKFDVHGSVKVNIELFDGYTEKLATAKLGFSSRGKLPNRLLKYLSFQSPLLSLRSLNPCISSCESESDHFLAKQTRASLRSPHPTMGLDFSEG